MSDLTVPPPMPAPVLAFGSVEQDCFTGDQIAARDAIWSERIASLLRAVPPLPREDVNPHDWRCLFSGLTEVDHDYSVQSETIGDYGVVNGTATYHWLECEHCGHKKQASYADLSDDYGDWYE